MTVLHATDGTCVLGVIIEYRLIQNDRIIFYTPSELQFLIEGLSPYSLHTIRVEVCTIQGCGSSETVEVRTMEASPLGTVTLHAVVMGSREVNARWSAPVIPNGHLIYDVFFQGLFYVDPGQSYSILRIVYFSGMTKKVHSYMHKDVDNYVCKYRLFQTMVILQHILTNVVYIGRKWLMCWSRSDSFSHIQITL